MWAIYRNSFAAVATEEETFDCSYDSVTVILGSLFFLGSAGFLCMCFYKKFILICFLMFSLCFHFKKLIPLLYFQAVTSYGESNE